MLPNPNKLVVHSQQPSRSPYWNLMRKWHNNFNECFLSHVLKPSKDKYHFMQEMHLCFRFIIIFLSWHLHNMLGLLFLASATRLGVRWRLERSTERELHLGALLSYLQGRYERDQLTDWGDCKPVIDHCGIVYLLFSRQSIGVELVGWDKYG